MALPTNIVGPFDVTTDDLIQIDATQAVDLFRQLLVIEAIKVGIPCTSVNVPSAITVSDGGIDAEVEMLPSGGALPAGLISSGRTYYQIKTGQFSASTASDIRSLLVQPKFQAGNHDRKKDELQPRVLSCFENGGAFVVVLFGSDLVGTTDDHGVAQIKEFMAKIDPAFATNEVRIIRANQLCSAIKMLAPGIAMRLNRAQGYDHSVFHELSFMANSCGLEIEVYQPTEELVRATEQITNAANNLNGFQHVRILGDAGAGKTHLMYRALTASIYSGCVLYCPDPEQALASGPMMALRQMAPKTPIILIADECDLETAEGLTALFKKVAAQMLLVTAHNVAEPPTAHANTQIIEVPRLQQPVVTEIFKGYGIPPDDAGWLATLCEGSPRAAHRLGQYIQLNPGQQPSQQLAHLDVLWDRIVCTPYNVESQDGQDRLVVIRTLALFRQIAWDTPEGAAAQAAVLGALQSLDPYFSQLKLSRSVEALRNRRVLQGPRTLLISPKLLHVAMWKSWFENYANLVDVLQLRSRLDSRMQQNFDAMLEYVLEAKAATKWAERLLGEGGVFATLAGYSDASNASLFFAVAQANPKAALRRFAVALGRESVVGRKTFGGDARRNAVHSLERFAVPARTFFEAANCLLLLAEAENESWSNNATGVFVSLFGVGYGAVAASELSPLAKVDYLRRLLQSDVPFRRQIAVDSLSKSLNPFMSRTSLDETIGLRRLPDRWMPQTYGELYEAYEAHVDLLEESINFLPASEGTDAAKGILTHVRSLILIPPLAKKILAFLRHTAGQATLREQCIETIVATLHYEGDALPEDIRTELQAIRAELTESSFTDKLHRHAGMKLIEDSFDAEGQHSDAARPELIQLVTQTIGQPDLLQPELTWLVTHEAKNGYQFGQLLGQSDDQLFLKPIVSAWIQAGPSRSDFFIGGYFSAIFAKDVAQWERLIEDLLANVEISNSVFGLIWRSGMSDRMARLLLAKAVQGDVDPKSFRLLVYGGVISQLPLDVIQRLVGTLIESNDHKSGNAALDILDSRLRSRPQEIDALASYIENVLNLATFVKGESGERPDTMLMFHWNALANTLLDQDPVAGARLAVQCIVDFGAADSITSGFQPESWLFLSNAAKATPDIIWPAIAKRLEEQRDDLGTWYLLNWLRGGRSLRKVDEAGLNAIPASTVFEWINDNVLDRAPLFATNCPPMISKPEEPVSFARQMLVLHGGVEQVRNNLHSNNLSGVWSGPASDHYSRKLADTDAHLVMETNSNVRLWLQEHHEMLERVVEQEKERELRD